MRPVWIIVAQMLLMSANSKYYLIYSRDEVGQEKSGADDDTDNVSDGNTNNFRKLIQMEVDLSTAWVNNNKLV